MEKVANIAEKSGTFLFGRNGAMLRKIIDRAAIGMAVTGMDGAVVYTNQAFKPASWRLRNRGLVRFSNARNWVQNQV